MVRSKGAATELGRNEEDLEKGKQEAICQTWSEHGVRAGELMTWLLSPHTNQCCRAGDWVGSLKMTFNISFPSPVGGNDGISSGAYLLCRLLLWPPDLHSKSQSFWLKDQHVSIKKDLGLQRSFSGRHLKNVTSNGSILCFPWWALWGTILKWMRKSCSWSSCRGLFLSEPHYFPVTPGVCLWCGCEWAGQGTSRLLSSVSWPVHRCVADEQEVGNWVICRLEAAGVFSTQTPTDCLGTAQ